MFTRIISLLLLHEMSNWQDLRNLNGDAGVLCTNQLMEHPSVNYLAHSKPSWKPQRMCLSHMVLIIKTEAKITDFICDSRVQNF